MTATAKLFKAGNSQAVRLPKAFRMAGTEVWIKQDPVTGEVTLKPKPKSRKKEIEELMAMLRAHPFPDDFMSKRSDAGEKPRNPFADWKD